jgi:indoleamine 2,3-dioxygenase
MSRGPQEQLDSRALQGSQSGFPVYASFEEILRKYDLSADRGFLPVEDPIDSLPARYESWSEPQTLRELILSDKVRDRVRALPPLHVPDNESRAVLRRLHSLIALIAHAYLVGDATREGWESSVLHEFPAPLAQAFVRVSELIDHVPIITHADTVLWNWKRKDKSSSRLETDNLELLIGQLKSPSESWFFLITTELEWRGARAVNAILRCCALPTRVLEHAVTEAAACETLSSELVTLSGVLVELVGTLQRMRDQCVPNVFYREVRPYVTGWERGSSRHPHGVIFRGCYHDEPQFLYGGSAAQSALVQLLDSFFGVQHEAPYLLHMRLHMPAEHRHLVNDVAALAVSAAPRHFVASLRARSPPALAALAAAESSLSLLSESAQRVLVLWDRCITTLREFRSEHLKIATLYIVQQAHKETTAGLKGTGGTELVPFLRKARDETQ